MLRTHTCGELNKALVDKEVTLSGWVDTVRNYGKLAFVDLRDRYGITQVILSAKDIPDIDKLRNEDILKITGKVKSRLEGKENKDISTGDIEVKASSLKILSKSKDLPFEINKDRDWNNRIVEGVGHWFEKMETLSPYCKSYEGNIFSLVLIRRSTIFLLPVSLLISSAYGLYDPSWNIS